MLTVCNSTNGPDSSVRNIADGSHGSIGHVADRAYSTGSDTCIDRFVSGFV